GIEPLMARLGVAEAFLAAGFLRHEGNWVRREEERRFVPFGSDAAGPWRGFQAWRADFDALLLERARKAGTVVCQPCRVLDPIVLDGRVSGIPTATGPA